jgi:hypothetical protein
MCLAITLITLIACHRTVTPSVSTKKESLGTTSAAFSNQTVWHVNELTGNNNNTGLTAATALQSVDEIVKRQGIKWRINNTQDFFFDSNITSARFSMSIGPLGFVAVHCTRTVSATGTLTGFTVDTQLTEATTITDTSRPSWTPGTMIVMTSGAASGAKYWVAKDLGNNTARVSRPSLFNIYVDPLNPTFPTPAIGDSYQVVNLSSISNFNFDIDGFAGVQQNKSQLVFQDCAIQNTEESLIPITFDDCKTSFLIGQSISLGNTCVTGVFITEVNGASEAGLFLNAFMVAYGVWFFNEHPILQNTSPFQKNGLLYIEDYAGFYDVANPITIWYGSKVFVRHGIYGTGISQAVIDVQPGGQFRYNGTVFSFTGQTNDVVLGGRTQVPQMNPTSGALGALMTTSFTNLSAAYPTGFGGSACDPYSTACFLLVPDSTF